METNPGKTSKHSSDALKPSPSPDSVPHLWQASTPHCHHQSSHTHLKEGLLQTNLPIKNVQSKTNIATGETSPVITPFHFYGYSNFSNFYQ